MQSCGKRTGKGKGTTDGKGKGKGMDNGNGTGNGIVKQTPWGDNISHAIGFKTQNEMYEADSDTEGSLEREYFQPETTPAMSISYDNDTDRTESDGKLDSEFDPDMNIGIENDVYAPDRVDLDSAVDLEMVGDDVEEDDED